MLLPYGAPPETSHMPSHESVQVTSPGNDPELTATSESTQSSCGVKVQGGGFGKGGAGGGDSGDKGGDGGLLMVQTTAESSL